MASKRDSKALEEAIVIRGGRPFRFKMKFFKNWLLERMASNFPIPSWRVKMHRMRGINIGKEVYIGYEVIFDRIHPELITIEDYAEIGDRCIISSHSRGSAPLRDRYPRTVGEVNIGEGVWMAPGCIVIQGVTIGKESVIGTGAVVTKDIPAHCLAAGVPAKIIKQI